MGWIDGPEEMQVNLMLQAFIFSVHLNSTISSTFLWIWHSAHFDAFLSFMDRMSLWLQSPNNFVHCLGPIMEEFSTTFLNNNIVN